MIIKFVFTGFEVVVNEYNVKEAKKTLKDNGFTFPKDNDYEIETEEE